MRGISHEPAHAPARPRLHCARRLARIDRPVDKRRASHPLPLPRLTPQRCEQGSLTMTKPEVRQRAAVGEATCGTIRLKLLKLAGLVRISARRIKFALASACPYADEWRLAAARLA